MNSLSDFFTKVNGLFKPASQEPVEEEFTEWLLGNSYISVQDMVIQDLEDRKQIGIDTYGKLLYVDNDRSHLIDLYEELLDACIYLRALIEEGNGRD